jgi:hypothetical protein
MGDNHGDRKGRSAGALVVGPGPFLATRRELLVALAAKIAIHAGYETRATAVAGGLTSCGASPEDGYRQAGVYTGRILKGKEPADLLVLLALLTPTRLPRFRANERAKVCQNTCLVEDAFVSY